MQGLDTEQLEYAFQLHGINRDAQARAFYADLWNLIQAAEKIREEDDLSTCQKDLRTLCKNYFAQMALWRSEEEDQHDTRVTCQASRENTREAASLIDPFEKQFFRYALCYLELNRTLIQMRVKISHLAKNVNIDSADILEVNHATGPLLSRAHAERMEIMEKRLRLDRVRNILKGLDPLMEQLGDGLPRAYGQNEGDHQITLFKGALRKKNFDAAKSVARGWNKSKLTAAGLRVIELVQTHKEDLKAQDGLMLHTGELSLISSFVKSDETRVNGFLDKFNVPYMVFQYKNLIHQGYLLGRIGSIEGLIIQHAKLLSLASRPHNDPAYAHMQEQTILVPARDQMQGRFKMLGAIFNDMETTVAVLEKIIAVSREYQASLPTS